MNTSIFQWVIYKHAEPGDGAKTSPGLKMARMKLKISGYGNFGPGITNPVSKMSNLYLVQSYGTFVPHGLHQHPRTGHHHHPFGIDLADDISRKTRQQGDTFPQRLLEIQLAIHGPLRYRGDIAFHAGEICELIDAKARLPPLPRRSKADRAAPANSKPLKP